MSLQSALTATHIIETAHNYARADDPFRHPAQPPAADGPPSPGAAADAPWLSDSFWPNLFASPAGAPKQVYQFRDMRVSEWVARVPGLFWKPEAMRLRDSVMNARKLIGGYAYHPFTRSAQVTGGVGTLRLEPDERGSWLATLTDCGDVAAGVPALISAEVWERIQKEQSCEGRVIAGTARWVPMSRDWSERFPMIHDIPRGYLLLDDPAAITVSGGRAWTDIAPFTIMEYECGASELFDYVYMGVRTDEIDYRRQVADFFSRYQEDIGGNARYLIAADMVQPLWDAEFLDPAQLRRQDAGAKSQLRLLEARVRERMLGQQVIEPLLDQLGETVLDQKDLIVLSDELALKRALWLGGGTLAEQVSQFVDAVMQHNKLETLIARLAAQRPHAFVDSPE